MKDKFIQTIEELQETVFPKIKDILVVILYGSVARGDHSQRHSDLDLFIISKKKRITEKTKDKIDKKLFSVGYKHGAKIHAEYQGLEIKDEDRSLIKKMIEEGKIIYSTGVFSFDQELIGLKQYKIYQFSLKNVKRKTMFSKILHGRKSFYYKGKKKVVKEYPGIIDGKEIIELGRGALMVDKKREKYVKQMFNDFNVEYKLKKIVYG